MAALRRAEGHGEIRANGAPRDLAGVGIHAGRQVHGDHRGSRLVQLAEDLDARRDGSFRTPARARAEQRIEPEIPVIARPGDGVQLRLGRRPLDGNAVLAQRLERAPRIATNGPRIPEHDDPRSRAALAELLGGDEAVAAVAAGAAQDEGAEREQRAVAGLDRGRDADTGAAHQLEAGHVTGLDRPAIERPRLLRRQQQHARAPALGGMRCGAPRDRRLAAAAEVSACARAGGPRCRDRA